MTEDLIRHSAREVVARLATGDLSPHRPSTQSKPASEVLDSLDGPL